MVDRWRDNLHVLNTEQSFSSHFGGLYVKEWLNLRDRNALMQTTPLAVAAFSLLSQEPIALPRAIAKKTLLSFAAGVRVGAARSSSHVLVVIVSPVRARLCVCACMCACLTTC